MELFLDKKITKDEMKKFMVTNSLEINNFAGYRYELPVFATYVKNKKTELFPEYSSGLINNGITLEDAIHFSEDYHECFDTEKTIYSGRIITIYKLVYKRNVPDVFIDEYVGFSERKLDIEITFQEGLYHTVRIIHLDIQPYVSLLGAIRMLFTHIKPDGTHDEESEENTIKNAMPFITKISNDEFSMTLYNSKGKEKMYAFPNLMAIYDSITSVRIISKGD